jgi:hypothetical protein
VNNINSIKYWIPIVPENSSSLTTQEWICRQSDHLLCSGDKIYRLKKNDEVTLEDASVPSYWNTAMRIAMLATLILPIIALIIKFIDRSTHKYTLVSPSPLHSPILTTSSVEDEEELSEYVSPLMDEDPPSPETEIGKKSPETKHYFADLKLDNSLVQADALQKGQEEERLKDEEEKKIKPEKEKKAKEEKEKKEIEFYRKCHKVAERVFPKMVEMFYRPDRELNNDLAKHQAYTSFWGMQEDKYPEKLIEKAEDFETEGKIEEAEKCRKQAAENEKHREEYLSKFQEAFFPVEFQGGTKLTRQEAISDCSEDVAAEEFFHGTTKARAEFIKKEGFDPEFPAGHRHLDSGYGIYLALWEKDAQAYAKKDTDGVGAVLRIKVKSKLQLAQYDLKMFMVVNDCFTVMARLFVRKNEETILQEIKTEGLNHPTTPTLSCLDDINYPLVNLFTRHFYTNHGYRGVYAPHSHRAGCSYLNLFYPKEDIVSIT